MADYFNHGYALIIGVGTTKEPKWSLTATVRDAQALKAVLTDPNFCAYPDNLDHLRLLHDQGATRVAILDGLKWLKEKAAADPEATIILYYSGHGIIESEQYYLIPHDFVRTDIPQTAFAAQTLTEMVRDIKAKRLWVIIDSCHAEGMAVAKDDLPADFLPTALPKGVIDALKQGEGRAVFTSSRGNQVSWIRSDQTLSVYTYHLIEALKGAANQPNDRFVTIGNVMAHLGKTVPETARTMGKEQTPFYDAATEDFPVAMLGGGKGLPSQSQSPDLSNVMSDREIVTPALAMARRSLAILEEQAAGFGRLQMPAHLKIELEEKRREVLELEKRLRHE
jgi:uncharacterized caspase-like protein